MRRFNQLLSEALEEDNIKEIEKLLMHALKNPDKASECGEKIKILVGEDPDDQEELNDVIKRFTEKYGDKSVEFKRLISKIAKASGSYFGRALVGMARVLLNRAR